MAKNLLAVQETPVQSLSWEDPLTQEMTTHSSILTWRIPRMESLEGYLPSMGLQRVGHHRVTNTLTFHTRGGIEHKSHVYIPGKMFKPKDKDRNVFIPRSSKWTSHKILRLGKGLSVLPSKCQILIKGDSNTGILRIKMVTFGFHTQERCQITLGGNKMSS